jgi:stringent starvation protein B
MRSSRPYLVRALHEWISDNGLTPYLLVNATIPGCQLPETYVKDGRIVFNTALDVVEDLVLDNEAINFTARFSGVPTHIYVPIEAVVAIYAKENGEGMAFSEEPVEGDKKGSSNIPKGTKGKPHLKIVK